MCICVYLFPFYPKRETNWFIMSTRLAWNFSNDPSASIPKCWDYWHKPPWFILYKEASLCFLIWLGSIPKLRRRSWGSPVNSWICFWSHLWWIVCRALEINFCKLTFDCVYCLALAAALSNIVSLSIYMFREGKTWEQEQGCERLELSSWCTLVAQHLLTPLPASES